MTDDDRRFAHGVLTGIAAAAVLIQIWLAVELAPLRAMYAEFGGQLPALTRLTISPLWLWAMPALSAGAVAALIWSRPRRSFGYLVTAVVAIAVVVATWHFSQAPLHELAGAIRD